MSLVLADAPIIDLAEDLEDGEIDDDEEEEQQPPPPKNQAQKKPSAGDDDVQFVGVEAKNQNADEDVVYMGPSTDSGGPQNSSCSKLKKPRPLEDDHASNIEMAIANALKKKGIEPPMPRMRSSNQDAGDVCLEGSGEGLVGGGNHLLQPSRSSRRRKRKKEREREQKKDKEHQKRSRREEDDVTGVPGGVEDMDEYEMMNVRGGSPPPGGVAPPLSSCGQRFGGADWDMDDGPAATGAAGLGAGGGGGYDSQQDPYSSYDSYSDEDANAPSLMNQRRRTRRDREKEHQRGGNNRKRRDRDRHEGGLAGGGNKRNRRDSGDAGGGGGQEKMGSSNRVEPRKLELCKFYLMDCCAKRDKCSYMHKEFPCKYYYLGMDCYAGDACLFHHGEPLSEQLRNILLKHMETAPKEILGDFKRISRDIALVQMTRRHEQLCEQFNRENTWSSMGGGGMGRRQDQHMQQQQQQQQQMQQQQQQMQQQQQQMQQQQEQQQTQQQQAAAEGGGCIPSLLDMVINPPHSEKKRKSRWTDKTAARTAAGAAASLESECTSPDAKPLPPHLDLANLSHVLSSENMAKLNKLGITNLEQMLQVPFGQLTEAGLTLVEIGEIQRKAEDAKPQTQAETGSSTPPTKRETEANNSNSNSNGFIMVDYTQYLKDAHVSFSGNDPLDDDRDDDEQLVIDDGNDSTAEEEQQPKQAKPPQAASQDSGTDEAPLPSVFDLPSFMNNMLGQGSSARQLLPASATSPNQESSHLPGGDQLTQKSAPTGSGTSTNVLSRILFGDKQSDPEARAAFYRDIIRNPFKAHSGDGDVDSSNENSNSNSHSLTPTPTPEPGSQSPKQEDQDQEMPELPVITTALPPTTPSLYVRRSMYDFDPVKEQELGRQEHLMEEKEQYQRDTDMRLPFVPMKHYLPATEIDAAIFSHTPLRWQLQEVSVEETSYAQIRASALHKEQRDLRDPRMRRILGLPEMPDNSGALGSTPIMGASSLSGDNSARCTTSIASPDSETTVRDSTPSSPPPSLVNLPSMSVPPPSMRVPPPNLQVEKPVVRTDPRRDPRRAALQAQTQAASTGNSTPAAATNASGGSKQISEIRSLLQVSNWYKNLGSNNKIMVNQQLALVFTELKKFHQLPNDAPKIFDVSFIVNNTTLQQIFAKLFIFVDDNGQVVQIPEENNGNGGGVGGAGDSGVGGGGGGVVLPNLSQPPPNLSQMLRQPPPNMQMLRMSGMMMQMGNLGPPFNQPPPRGGLLGMPPNGNGLNQGVGNPGGLGQLGMNQGGGGGGGGGGGVGGLVPNGNPFNPFAGNNGGGAGVMNNMSPMGNMGMAFKNFNNGNNNNNNNGGGRGGHFPGGNGNGNNRNQRGGNQRNRNI
ncbi:protein suppressor of sable [Drosophila yakuba]|uniref:Su(S), isoform A n=2 Tax=Drosophila yakuba TaxID=7245 RepID=B4PX20_DROYA|nr:protein suppressor of sable [Drosophila yakuba]XP_015045349.1 protein suppressor of sable [Drosophila yakuba]XP_039233648.1 protein suppressor of sable [Drosophila yakuba]EDX00806.1 su(s), isoform A [Drosophila yakuba]KRK05789.1 su(s), isoform B [Drosophila yakuba]